MLHLAQSKPQFPRTKHFPTASARNKFVTLNLNSTSAPWHTLTKSIEQNHNARVTNDPTYHVAVTLQRGNTPRHQNRDFLARNIHSATHRGCSFATRNFYSVRAHLAPIASSLWPAYVRVLSEYSYIPDQSNLDFPERNTRNEAPERKSTRTSFLKRRTHVGQAFQPDNCASLARNLSPIRNHIHQARKPDLHSYQAITDCPEANSQHAPRKRRAEHYRGELSRSANRRKELRPNPAQNKSIVRPAGSYRDSGIIDPIASQDPLRHGSFAVVRRLTICPPPGIVTSFLFVAKWLPERPLRHFQRPSKGRTVARQPSFWSPKGCLNAPFVRLWVNNLDNLPRESRGSFLKSAAAERKRWRKDLTPESHRSTDNSSN